MEWVKGVVEIDGETANVKFAYDQQLVSRIKDIAGRRCVSGGWRWKSLRSEVEESRRDTRRPDIGKAVTKRWIKIKIHFKK